MFCDLHTHSTSSDGTTSPADLAQLAHKVGLTALALTDHDTTDGLAACESACRKLGVGFVPGIEVSADPGPPQDAVSQSEVRRGTMHILGLFVRHDDDMLQRVRDRMRAARQSRNPAIVQKLNELGVRIDYEQVLELADQEGTAIIGRPHIAQILVGSGYAKSIQDAFNRYLRQGAAAYVRRDRLPPAEAISAIHHAGALALLAHPVQLGCENDSQLAHIVRRLVDEGLDGLETRHCDHTAADTERFEALAARYGLLISGGSDFHGSRKAVELGSQKVPVAVYETLLANAG